MNKISQNAMDILYGSYIKYDRLDEMVNYILSKSSNVTTVNVYIDCYSILKALYIRPSNLLINDSCAIASSLINLAIHLKSFFRDKKSLFNKIYIIYGGARPKEAFINFPYYNQNNILMEDSNYTIQSFIHTGLSTMQILCPYLYDIFCIVDYENEFSVISNSLIRDVPNSPDTVNIVYSKDSLSYQLIRRSDIYLFRPKKSISDSREVIDSSWIVDMNNLYDSYRYRELSLKTIYCTNLSPHLFSEFQAIAGIKTRSIKSIKNCNSAIKILEEYVLSNNLYGLEDYREYSFNLSDLRETTDIQIPFYKIFSEKDAIQITNRFAAIDILFQTLMYNQNSINKQSAYDNIVNLSNPREVRLINDKYFVNCPLDLNRL